jgi:hypothetical protein
MNVRFPARIGAIFMSATRNVDAAKLLSKHMRRM